MKMGRHTVSTTVKLRMNPSAPAWVFKARAKHAYALAALFLALALLSVAQTRYADALGNFLTGWLLASLAWFWGLVEQRERRSFDIDLTAEVDS